MWSAWTPAQFLENGDMHRAVGSLKRQALCVLVKRNETQTYIAILAFLCLLCYCCTIANFVGGSWIQPPVQPVSN